jgi:molybdenum cofactor cytidylyltransferase
MPSAELKIAGIILAAGLSRRMGTVKSLLPLGESLLLDRVVENAHQSELESLIVVLGHDAENILKKIDFKDSRVIINPDYRMGHSSSLRAGLDAVSADTDGALFLLGDQPFVGSKTIDMLIRAFRKQPSSLIIPTCQGKRGNPVLAHRRIFKMIQGITGDTGPRVFFSKLKEEIQEVDVFDPGIYLDIDTVEDYRRLTGLLSSSQKDASGSKIFSPGLETK